MGWLQKTALVAVLMVGCAPALYSDPGPYAFAASDTTALLSGCGSKANVGYLYCRFVEGWTPQGEFVVIVPPTNCPDIACGTVKVFAPNGAVAFEAPVQKGKTYVQVPLAKLLGPGPLLKGARGFYPVLLSWRWLDDNGLAQQSTAEGEVRVRVYGADYVPLGLGAQTTWRWSTGGVTFAMTDKARAVIEP